MQPFIFVSLMYPLAHRAVRTFIFGHWNYSGDNEVKVRRIRMMVLSGPQECVTVEQQKHSARCETKAKQTEVVTEGRPASVMNVG
jgi:hypothetical protein